MSSFFCERTAEYTLVTPLQQSLASRFGSAIPIFYWATREGNRISSDIHRGYSVRVLAMFARRPKVNGTKHIIEGKVNSELIQFAKAAHAAGIITIVGFPAVVSIFQLGSDPLIFWFSIDSFEDGDFHFFTDISEQVPVLLGSNGGSVRTLTLDQILHHTEQVTVPISWDSAMEKISELRLRHDQGSFSPWNNWFGGYKPVYFLIPTTI